MNSALTVGRMLSSLSNSKTPVAIDKYLQVFGVTKVSNELPPVFDPEYASTWRAVLSDSKYLSKDPKVRLLLTILDYIKFMRSQRLNPFIVINGKSLNKVIRPNDIEKGIMVEAVGETYVTIMNFLRKSGIPAYFKESSRIVQLSFDRKTLNCNFAFVPLRKESIESIVYNKLAGKLYRNSCPVQLQTQVKDNQKSFKVALQVLSTSQASWLPLTSINNFKVYARATKDALAIRVTIPVDTDYTKTPKDLQELTRVWRTVK